jgi:glycosyltransferase involved in cell wall biosynthesis
LGPLSQSDPRAHSYDRTWDQVPEFADLVRDFKPDVVHFHDQSGGASLSHLRIVKALGIPSVLTFHTPGQFCPERSLLRGGTVPCDGKVTPTRCTRCRLQSAGVSAPIAALAALPNTFKYEIGNESRLHRLLTARQMTMRFMASNTEWFNSIDRVIALASWAFTVLEINGCPQSKIRLVRTGGDSHAPAALATPGKGSDDQDLSIAVLGRCEPYKGFQVVVDAVKQLPWNIKLKVHFFSPNFGENSFGLDLLQKIDTDSRFARPQSLPNKSVAGELAKMDLMVIPSLWLETGPLTLFDALSVGLPVIGSRLGGIAELIRDGENGRLFTPGSAAELADLLETYVADRSSLRRLATGIRPPRSMDDVALEMHEIYDELLHPSRDR